MTVDVGGVCQDAVIVQLGRTSVSGDCLSGAVSDTGNSVRLRSGRSMNLSEPNKTVNGVDLRQALIQAARAQVEQLPQSSQALLRLEFERAEDQARAVILSGAARSL